MRYGMIIDLNRCYGCNACAIICKQKNATPPKTYWCRVESQEIGDYPNARKSYKPAMCMHCKEAPCVKECPTGASHVTENGLVGIKQSLCTACLRCMAVCPYEARFVDLGERERYFPGKEKNNYEQMTEGNLLSVAVNKCTMCKERIDKGEKPACADICPTGARTFGDLDSAEMQNLIIKYNGYQEKAYLGTDPSVFYLPKR